MSTRQSFGFTLTVDLGTDVGRIRDNNEDSNGHAWLDDGSLFVIVADGMGGHEAGEVASSLAVRVVEDMVREDLDADPRDRLYNALLDANQAILEEGQTSGTRGMGTTAITAVFKGNQAYVGQVGDSRCYLFRHGHKIWRSTDHTRVQMLVAEGKLTEEQARNHPEAGMLTRALGHARMADGQPLVPEVQDEPLILEAGDTMLLCSDGLHDLVEDWEIGQMIAGKSGPQAIDLLIETACDRGGHDNITVAVVTAGKKIQPYDPNFQPPQVEQRAYVDEPATEESYQTFDDGGEFVPQPGGHLHAPTMAPEPGSAPPPAPAAAPAAPVAAPVAAAPVAAGGEEVEKKSKLPMIIGGAVAAVFVLLLLLGCVGGLIAALMSGALG